jgi:hypothetical protein
MRFRRLTIEELKALEPELKQFLIVNEIYGDDWEKLNQENPDKAQALVDVFSDNVLDKVYSKIDFLEKRASNAFSVFSVTNTDIETITIQSNTIELFTNEQIEVALNQHLAALEIFCGTKKIETTKSDEVFKLIQSGCDLSTYDVWHSFSSFLDQLKKTK